jgi:hypothetical protein
LGDYFPIATVTKSTERYFYTHEILTPVAWYYGKPRDREAMTGICIIHA